MGNENLKDVYEASTVICLVSNHKINKRKFKKLQDFRILFQWAAAPIYKVISNQQL